MRVALLAVVACGATRGQQQQPARRLPEGAPDGSMARTPFTVRNEGGALVTEVHVAMLDEHGHIQVPHGVTEAIVEIGCSDRDTVDDQLDTKYPNAFLLSFEPLLDKYAALAARGPARFEHGKKDRGVPLGRHHKRGVVLPLAVSKDGGEATIKVHRWAGCSSLFELNKDTAHSRLCLEGELERRRVPTITLERAISLVPPHLPIRLLKLDAQGTDVQLLQSVPPHFLHRRVQYIEFESIGAACTPIYVGQPGCDVATAHLRAIGYAVRNGTKDVCASMKGNPYAGGKKSIFGWGCEATLEFERMQGSRKGAAAA